MVARPRLKPAMALAGTTPSARPQRSSTSNLFLGRLFDGQCPCQRTGVASEVCSWQAAVALGRTGHLVGFACAGLVVNSLRLTTGRPRPLYERIPDGFYGICLDHRYHAFPSGHSATAWGTATALVVTVPAVGLAAVAGATVVGWSRMYLRAHRPTDVWTGAGLGVIFEVVLGIAARRVVSAGAGTSPASALGSKAQ